MALDCVVGVVVVAVVAVLIIVVVTLIGHWAGAPGVLEGLAVQPPGELCSGSFTGPRTVTLPQRSPIRDQNEMDICVPIALLSALEMMRADGVVLSELFLYYTARFDVSQGFLYPNYLKARSQEERIGMLEGLLRMNFDTGLRLQDGLVALSLYGACPYSMAPSVKARMNDPPSDTVVREASRNRICNFVQLDTGQDPCALIDRMRQVLVSGIPLVTCFIRFPEVLVAAREGGGRFPLPAPGSVSNGGHCAVLVGYDDDLVISAPGFPTTRGAFRLQNSWGPTWGDSGFGYLPYAYASTTFTSELISPRDRTTFVADRVGGALLFDVHVLQPQSGPSDVCRSGSRFVSSYPIFLEEFRRYGLV